MRFITSLVKNVRDGVKIVCSEDKYGDCELTIYMDLLICFVIYPILFIYACICNFKVIKVLFITLIFVFVTAGN